MRILEFPTNLSAEQKKDRRYSRNFEDFVRNNKVFKGDRTFHIAGEDARGRGKVPDHKVWEYSELANIIDGKDPITHYHVAATYRLGDREVALVYDFWAFDNRADKRAIKLGRKLVEGVTPVAVADASAALAKDPRAKHADTPAKMAALETAARSIQDLEGWDFETTERYVVIYSHDGGSKQKKAAKAATALAEVLAALRARFEADWPPADGQDLGYPVLRVCHERDMYSAFSTSSEQVGRFVPESGEVVIFNDKGGEVADKNAVRQTMIAAAWQQYAAAYWPGAPFQRWWLYGTSDYYAQFEPKGRKLRHKPISNPYVYFETDERRFKLENPMLLIKADLRSGDYVGLRDFVAWDNGKFDGARPANNRAQAYAVVDFLARGPEKLGDKFDASWAKFWRDYPAMLAKSKSPTKTIDKLSEGVDFAALEDAWKNWVKRQM